MKSVAIVGAGFAGVATARVLSRLEHDVTIFDAAPDVGGVWSKTRSYPALKTQSPAANYLSEQGWPKGTAECPSGPQVQAYLDSYVHRFELARLLQLQTQVVSAVHTLDKRWTLTLRATDDAGRPNTAAPTTTRTFDILIICNGPYSQPNMPEFPGREAFIAAGGKVMHTSELLDLDMARAKNVVVVGYGKSACDAAAAISTVTKQTTVVARRLHWKFPRRVLGVIPTHRLLLPRVGEALFLFKEPGLVSRLLHGPLSMVRSSMIGTLAYLSQSHCGLSQLGLVPDVSVETAASAAISVVSDGFFDGVRTGAITIRRDMTVLSLGTTADGKPAVMLANGECVPADLLVLGTGWKQAVPFLSDKVLSQFTDAKSHNFHLYRGMQPADVDNLWFNYNGSLYTATSVEVGALWIAAAIEGTLPMPSPSDQKLISQEWVGWLEARGKKHSHATDLTPFSTGMIDTILADLNVHVSPFTYLSEWFNPLNPASYKSVADRVVEGILARRVAA